eukprot:9249176-Pyramimonas_sp.AAC.1
MGKGQGTGKGQGIRWESVPGATERWVTNTRILIVPEGGVRKPTILPFASKKQYRAIEPIVHEDEVPKHMGSNTARRKGSEAYKFAVR